MAPVEKISIALPAEMVLALRSAVDQGDYSSTSEVVREAIRAWILKRKVESLELDELRALAKAGRESGEGIDAEVVFTRLRSKFQAMVDEEEGE